MKALASCVVYFLWFLFSYIDREDEEEEEEADSELAADDDEVSGGEETEESSSDDNIQPSTTTNTGATGAGSGATRSLARRNIHDGMQSDGGR